MREDFAVVEELTILSDFNSLHDVESFIDSICNKIGVTESFGTILIAVTEAVNNAIIHGNKNNTQKNVYLKFADGPTAFCFTIEDEGNGFDFTSLPDPTAPENIEKENGRGIFLMKNLSDDLDFEVNGSRVSIYFNK